MKKKMLALLLTGVMAMSTLTACGGDKDVAKNSEPSKVEESTPSTEESKETEEVKDYTGQTLRIGWWGNDIRSEQTTKIIDEFAKQYPGLEVEVEYAGYSDYFTRLNTQAAGGEMPDVIQMDVGKYYMFACNNQLLDLEPYITDGTIDLSNVSESEVESTRVCDGLYAVATGMNGLCMLYNPAIVEEAGCTLSMQPTVSEFVDVAKKVYEKSGSLVHMITNDEILYRSLGGDLYADGEDALGFTEEMLLLRDQLYLQGVEDGYIRTAENAVEENVMAALTAGELWCIMESSNQVANYETGSGIELEVIAQPIADDAVVENPAYMKPAMMWSVAADTEMAELAVEFINYFVNDTYVYDVCGADRGVPISSEIRDYLSANLSTSDQKTYAYVDYLTTHSTPLNLYTPAKASEAMVPIGELSEKCQFKAVKMEELPELVHEAYEKAAALIAE